MVRRTSNPLTRVPLVHHRPTLPVSTVVGLSKATICSPCGVSRERVYESRRLDHELHSQTKPLDGDARHRVSKTDVCVDERTHDLGDLLASFTRNFPTRAFTLTEGRARTGRTRSAIALSAQAKFCNRGSGRAFSSLRVCRERYISGRYV